MRLCRYEENGTIQIGFYQDTTIIPVTQAAKAHGIELPHTDSLLPFLSAGSSRSDIVDLQQKLDDMPDDELSSLRIPVDEVALRVPIATPSKLMLLAGNYSKHIEEGGGQAAERAQTFPYVFMKPPLTTLTHPGNPVRIPEISPNHIDWELEIGVIIGKRARGVSEADALSHVAGYTIVNDISDREFKPNPDRGTREKDSFFDWLHGKWHDTFCPMGPCVLPAEEQPDPQTLHLTLRVNGEVEQDGSTAEMIFPVAAIVEFISSFVTLEPGDIISTGTTSGVGAAKNKYLKPGDWIEAEIENIGVLCNPVE